MIREIKLAMFQRKWLEEHGGRTSGDVMSDKDGSLYVEMGSGVAGREIKVYLPRNKNE